jgi:acetylornithine deacetylase/succinyl-diaminopimelate desuccinylase-like protein
VRLGLTCRCAVEQWTVERLRRGAETSPLLYIRPSDAVTDAKKETKKTRWTRLLLLAHVDVVPVGEDETLFGVTGAGALAAAAAARCGCVN